MPGRLRDQDPCFRAVIFSQFTSFLDLIQAVLERENLPWFRFDGSMDIKKRNEAVTGFKAPSRDAKVLIISLKAGGVGLNVSLRNPMHTCCTADSELAQLTNANHVFMVSRSSAPERRESSWVAALDGLLVERGHGEPRYASYALLS